MSKLIVFEGIDGAGKTTLAQAVRDILVAEGYEVRVTREPYRLFDRIRPIAFGALPPKAQALYMLADRHEHVSELIEPFRAQHEEGLLLCDRYTLSTVVYQGHLGGVNLKWIEQANNFVTNNIKPDLTLVLDVPPEIAIERKPDELKRLSPKLALLRNAYLYEANRREHHTVLDASQGVEAVLERAVALVRGLLPLPGAP